MRIIAGQFRGRKLVSPEGMETRPITDRVKAALFNSLAGWWPGARVADLFCGTGSMGLEALSRGARHCWFADASPSALARLRQNLAALKAADSATIWQGDIALKLSQWLTGLPDKLDVVLLDPPYSLAEQWMADPPVEAVFNPLADALADDGVAMFRTPRELAVPEALGRLQLGRRREYGSMALNYMQRPTAEQGSSA